MDRATPVMLLHAFPLNAAMWKPQRAALSSHRTLTPNFPGFGGSPAATSELDEFAQVGIDAMDVANIDRAVVVGLSMGGYVAFRLHALAPERISGLVLADTKAGADDETGRTRRAIQAERARQEGVGWLEELIPALLGETSRHNKPEVLGAVRAMLSQADPEGVARALEAMGARPDSTPYLGEIQVPVLVLVGEEDTLTPVDEARKIVEGVPDSQLVVIPCAGHLSNLESPERFNEALLRFLA